MLLKSNTQPVFILLMMLVTGIHCSKDNNEQSASAPLYIDFPSTGISASNVDSAIVLYTNPLKDSIKRKTFVKDGIIALRSEDLPAGQWTLFVKLYTHPVNDTCQMMYRIEKELSLPAVNLAIHAPTGRLMDDWKPTFVLSDKKYGIRLTIAQRPDDPYHEIFFPASHPLNYLWFDRVAFDDSKPEEEATIAYGWALFNGAGSLHGNHSDTTAFTEYCRMVKQAPRWSYTDFYVVSQESYFEEEVLFYARVDNPNP